jgi:uncharacterized cysteine cluster protein YcgN (CxxCxxCC family)
MLQTIDRIFQLRYFSRMNKANDVESQEWESICRRCARCCYEKIDFEGRIYYTELPCEFLDLATNTCKVYTERDKKRPGCVRLTKETVKKGFLPADCPYVSDIENYQAPMLPDDFEEEDL